MVGYRIKSGDDTGFYGFSDNYFDAMNLLRISKQHDPTATMEEYKCESQYERAERLQVENAILKKALELSISNHSVKQKEIERLTRYYIQRAEEATK